MPELHPSSFILHPFKTLSKTTLLDLGRYLVVENHVIQVPDGRVIPNWAWVITPDYVNILARTTGGQFIVFHQTKYSIPGETLAIVGGYLEPGEDPLAAAKRELQEETGYASEHWTSLGAYPVDGNRGCGTAHFFLALDAAFTTRTPSDDLEEQELLLLSESELRQAWIEGQFKLLPWAAIIGLALQHLHGI
jgi:ADP-ribose pyrophosphatase